MQACQPMKNSHRFPHASVRELVARKLNFSKISIWGKKC
jgi:hypothetical protein